VLRRSEAAEKAIKAVLVHRAISFPKTHDLNHLLSLAARNGIDIPQPIREADRLTRHAFESRYPGPWSVSEQDWVHALTLAEGVVRWAEALIVGAG
jgi:HEPN domain-containing protein